MDSASPTVECKYRIHKTATRLWFHTVCQGLRHHVCSSLQVLQEDTLKAITQSVTTTDCNKAKYYISGNPYAPNTEMENGKSFILD